jgi:hypothetical protein
MKTVAYSKVSLPFRLQSFFHFVYRLRLSIGGWVHGQWHGKGTAVFANGDKFDGNYDLDRRHGFGVYEWKDGRVYEGEFHMDQRQGVGEYRWPDGAIYRGEFMSGHRQGEGTYTFSDGSTYTGEWLKGRYHGVGQCIWKVRSVVVSSLDLLLLSYRLTF